jgi:hypothetical protein
MKRKLGIAALVMGLALTGCTAPNEETDPTPIASSRPVVLPTSTPTPEWTAEEQTAIDAVLAYREKWSYMSQHISDQNPDGGWMINLDDIYEVARNPLADTHLARWVDMRTNSTHLVGSPTLDISNVDRGMGNSEGQRYYVDACSILGDSYTADAQGNRLDAPGRIERAAFTYEVLAHVNGGIWVFSSKTKDRSC